MQVPNEDSLDRKNQFFSFLALQIGLFLTLIELWKDQLHISLIDLASFAIDCSVGQSRSCIKRVPNL